MIPDAIPLLDLCWSDRSRWTSLYEKPWRYVEEHINLKEGRVALYALRHVCSVSRHHRARALYIGDNLVSICAFERGRAKSYALNALCR